MQKVALPSGIELAYAESGPADAPALIFLHGFPENHRSWRHQIAHLEDRFRCIAPDQRGFGASSKPQEVEAYGADRLVGDIFQLADALNIGQFTILGHDWGGVIAWMIAAMGQQSGRVTRAVIANAPHPAIFQKLLWTKVVQREASQYMRAFRDTENDEFIRKNGLAAFLAKAIAWKRASPFDPLEQARLIAEWQQPDAPFAMLNWYRASQIVVPDPAEPYVLPQGYTPPPIPKIETPTLVIWALADEALSPLNIVGLEEHVGDLEIVEVADCGHFVQWERPDAVNTALDDFLARTAKSPGR
jgi:pimeloyl-ACP methyl ester carboxylesterase